MEINILGTAYIFELKALSEDSKLLNCDGYTDVYNKQIVVRHYTDSDMDEEMCSSLGAMESKNIRHELIHAFIYESGLWVNTVTVEQWAMNEEMIDWIAIQLPKINRVYEKIVLKSTHN